MKTKKKLTPGRAASRQRQNVIRHLDRTIRDYDKPHVTDQSVFDLLVGIRLWIRGSASRYNARPGGLGR